MRLGYRRRERAFQHLFHQDYTTAGRVHLLA